MNRLVLQFTAQLHLNRYSENSIQNHRLDLVKFKGWLKEADMGDLAALQKITPDHIRRYQGFLAGSLKQRSINRHLSSLRLFFGFMEESGLLAMNPMDTVVFPKTTCPPFRPSAPMAWVSLRVNSRRCRARRPGVRWSVS